MRTFFKKFKFTLFYGALSLGWLAAAILWVHDGNALNSALTGAVATASVIRTGQVYENESE